VKILEISYWLCKKLTGYWNLKIADQLTENPVKFHSAKRFLKATKVLTQVLYIQGNFKGPDITLDW